MIGTQSRPLDPARFFIDGMRNDRKRVHVQPDTRTVELTGGLLICNCGSTNASVHSTPATHVHLQPEAFGPKSASIPSSAGTTNTGSIDPLKAIADLCGEKDLWMHVDGAHGASVSLSTAHRHLGIERADSVSWDAHKWLLQSYGCGAVLVRDRRALASSFHTRPEYLQDTDIAADEVNFWDLSPELTRPARALKFWFSLQVRGVEHFAAVIDHSFQLAQWARDEVSNHPHSEVVSGAQLAIVNFRFAPAGLPEAETGALNVAISRKVLAEGFAGVFTTKLHGRTVLRMCTLSPQATKADIAATIAALDQVATDLQPR